MTTLDYLFLAPTLAVGSAAALHATGYLRGVAGGRLARFWLLFAATLAAMCAVVCAPDKLTFLLAWEDRKSVV